MWYVTWLNYVYSPNTELLMTKNFSFGPQSNVNMLSCLKFEFDYNFAFKVNALTFLINARKNSQLLPKI